MRENILPTALSAMNLAFYKKDNEKSAIEVVGALGEHPDLKRIANQPKDITVRFVRGDRHGNGHGASAEIEKGYSTSERFPGSTVPLAIKKMHWEDIDEEHPQTLYELIDREVGALKDLCYGENVFPALTRFFGSFYYPAIDEHWLAFEHCSGGDLSFMRTRPVNYDEIAAVAAGALAGLQYIHNRGYTHADIKPDNLLLAAPGIVKLCDFGLSANIRDVSTPELHALGTARYMSPEHMLRNNALDEGLEPDGMLYNHKTDIWALGVVLLEILVGRAPVFKLRRVAGHLFNTYIANMTKKADRYMGTALKDLLILRESYKNHLIKADILPEDDLDGLIQRCPVLKAHRNDMDAVLSFPHLRLEKIDTSRVMTKSKPGLYRLGVCLDFIAHCLICNYQKRPDATELKLHPFVKAVSKELDALLPIMEEVIVDSRTYGLKKHFYKKYQCQLTIKPMNKLLKFKEKNQRLHVSKMRARMISKFDV